MWEAYKRIDTQLTILSNVVNLLDIQQKEINYLLDESNNREGVILKKEGYKCT